MNIDDRPTAQPQGSLTHFRKFQMALTLQSVIWSTSCLVLGLAFRAGLLSSDHCCPDAWSTVDVDGLVQLYNAEITVLLDWLIPYRSVTYRQHSLDPWFDNCRAVKRRTRQLERAACRAAPCEVAAATAEWVAQRRAYARLRCQKREAL